MHTPTTGPAPAPAGTDWIDTLTDEQCMEVFWLYVDPPEPFLERYPPALLGRALRFALRRVAERHGLPPSAAAGIISPVPPAPPPVRPEV